MDVAIPPILKSLAVAIVDASTVPLLLLDDRGAIVGASKSFLDDFGLTETMVVGQPVHALQDGAWDAPELRSLLDAVVANRPQDGAREFDLEAADGSMRRLVLNASRLDYLEGNMAAVRLLLGVADVTDARAREALQDQRLREMAVLIEEVQHRVANSLQIIASVLLQSARKAGADESRAHLKAAHGRVIAIAQVQRLLAESAADEIAIGAYLATLCDSLAASMGDQGRIDLVTEADDSLIKGSVSVTIGLVVAELVINALKHAFPDGRAGRVTVGYRVEPGGWSMIVADDGVGMTSAGNDREGLGSNIVTTLARHLNAVITIADTDPGTRVTLHCTFADSAIAA